MKQTLIILLLLTLSKYSYSQTEYTLTQVAYRKVNKDGIVSKEPLKPLKNQLVARLYRNAFTIEGLNQAYKFVRKINQQEEDGEHVKWIATDSWDNVFEIMIVDYGNYSKIGILNRKTKEFTLYQTL